MTTIACAGNRMAADSHMVIDGLAVPSDKLLRVSGGIVGAAGDADACWAVISFLSGKGDKPKFGKNTTVCALYLTSNGLFYFEPDLHPHPIHDGIMAIGTGGQLAMGSMERDQLAGIEPNPITAVEVASRRDPYSGGPVQWLTLAAD